MPVIAQVPGALLQGQIGSYMTRKHTTILLIAGERSDQQYLEQCLEEAAMKVHLRKAETLYEGLQLLEKEQDIDLVLLDLSLPDVSGFKALTRYLEHSAHIPVIVISDLNNEIIGNQAVKAGAQDFLVKGQFDGKLLGRAIRYSLHRFATQKEFEEMARRLAISQSRYAEAQQMAHFGNWEMDLVSNTMYWSEEMKRIFGLPPSKADLSLTDYLEVVHPDERQDVEQWFEQVMKSGDQQRIEHRILVHGTKIRYIALRARISMDDRAGKPVLLGVVQDITERKLKEQLMLEQKVSRTAARISQEVLSELSFQIRTPLASVLNLLFLLDKTNLDEQQRELLQALQVSFDDLLLSVNNLLNFSVFAGVEMPRNEMEQDVEQLLQQIRQALALRAQHAGLELEFEVDREIPARLQFDPALTLQVLYSLIDTTIQFASAGSALLVGVRHQVASASKQWLHVTVHLDNPHIQSESLELLGQGEKLLESIEEEHLQRKDTRAALTMAISKRITRALGGELKVDYAPADKQLHVHLRLPATIVSAMRRFSGGKPEVPIKILLVEDHFLNQIATKQILTTWSPLVTVDIAENGLVGYEKFRAHGYDLVLMDIQMPEMNGIEAARKIREISDVPIIALTAHASRQEQDKCFEAGMNDYLTKPFQPEELYARIMHHMSMVKN